MILIVNNHQPLEQQLFIDQDLPLAVRDDDLREAARRDDRAGSPDFLLDAFDYAIDAGGCAVDDSALHTVNRVGADHTPGRIETDLWKLAGPGGEGIERNPQPRDDHAAEKVLILVDRRDRRRSPHVDDDQRTWVFVDGCDGICDPVASELGRVVQHDLQAGPDARADDHDRLPGQPHHRVLHRMCHRRNDGRDNSALERVVGESVQFQNVFNQDRVLQSCGILVG